MSTPNTNLQQETGPLTEREQSSVDQLKSAGPSPHAGDEHPTPPDEARAGTAPTAKDESLLGPKGDPAEGRA